MTVGDSGPGTYIAHSSAIVEPDVTIGAGTRVWQHAHIRSGAVVGAACTLGKNVVVDAGARIGDRCRIQNGVSVYRGVDLADDVFVGSVVTRSVRPQQLVAGNPARHLGWVCACGAVVGRDIDPPASLWCGQHGPSPEADR